MSLLFTYFYFWLCWVFIATRGLSLVMEMRAPLCCGVGHCGGCSCGGVLALGVQALVVVVLLGMWNLPRLGSEPVSRVLQGRCLSTVPPGKPPSVLFEDALDKLQISSLQAPGIHLIKHLDSYDWFDSFVAQSQICGPSVVTA